MIDMSRQKDNVDKGGKAYIDTLPKREQERLLGVHGRNDVMSGKKEWIASARGISDEGFKLRSPASSQRGAINIGKEDYWDSLTSEQKSRDMEAVKYYERLRHEDRAALVEMISESSGMHPKSVYKVLEHLLDNEYNLDRGRERFDEDYNIMQSLQRLIAGNPEEHDLIMLKHERLEHELMNRYGYENARAAHDIVERKHNYSLALDRWKNGNSKKNNGK